MRSSSEEGVGVGSPGPRPLQLLDDGGRQRVGADGATDGAGGRGGVQVVLPPQDSLLGSAGAVNSDSPAPGPVHGLTFGAGNPVEVDVVVGARTSRAAHLGLFGEVELQVDGHLVEIMQECRG